MLVKPDLHNLTDSYDPQASGAYRILIQASLFPAEYQFIFLGWLAFLRFFLHKVIVV